MNSPQNGLRAYLNKNIQFCVNKRKKKSKDYLEISEAKVHPEKISDHHKMPSSLSLITTLSKEGMFYLQHFLRRVNSLGNNCMRNFKLDTPYIHVHTHARNAFAIWYIHIWINRLRKESLVWLSSKLIKWTTLRQESNKNIFDGNTLKWNKKKEKKKKKRTWGKRTK